MMKVKDIDGYLSYNQASLELSRIANLVKDMEQGSIEDFDASAFDLRLTSCESLIELLRMYGHEIGKQQTLEIEANPDENQLSMFAE